MYYFFSVVVDLTCFGIHLVAQVAYRVQQQQSVAQLEARREDMRQEGHTANNPAPATVRVEVLVVRPRRFFCFEKSKKD